jgi:hypothetical protein
VRRRIVDGALQPGVEAVAVDELGEGAKLVALDVGLDAAHGLVSLGLIEEQEYQVAAAREAPVVLLEEVADVVAGRGPAAREAATEQEEVGEAVEEEAVVADELVDGIGRDADSDRTIVVNGLAIVVADVLLLPLVNASNRGRSRRRSGSGNGCRRQHCVRGR